MRAMCGGNGQSGGDASTEKAWQATGLSLPSPPTTTLQSSHKTFVPSYITYSTAGSVKYRTAYTTFQ